MTTRPLTTTEMLIKVRKTVIEKESLHIQAVISDLEFAREYFGTYKQIVIDDCIRAIDDVLGSNPDRERLTKTHGNLQYLIDIIMQLEFSEAEKDIQILVNLVMLHSFYRIKFLSKPDEVYIEEFSEIQKLFAGTDHYKWFRGHSDIDWELVPSIFREIKENQINFSYNYLCNDLTRKDITRKLNTIFEYEIFDYRKLAYTQHSLGYGPLLDFTKSSKIAFSFALSNIENVSKFFHKKFCVYELDTFGIACFKSKKAINKALKNLNIAAFKGNPHIESIIKTQIWIDLLTQKKESEIFLIDYQTNDRMRYQKGAFLLFNNVIIVGGRMILSLNKHQSINQRLKRYVFSEENRLAFYNKFLTRYPEYKIRFLMDPYSYFKE